MTTKARNDVDADDVTTGIVAELLSATPTLRRRT
jgi:hypothetical protein